MNYELAKKLKDAGFPQEGLCVCEHSDELNNKKQVNALETLQHDLNCEKVTYPTLSELIEACGDDFEMLVKTKEDTTLKVPSYWRAYPTEESYKGDCVVDCCGYETGDTPKIAVANLWLALQEVGDNKVV